MYGETVLETLLLYKLYIFISFKWNVYFLNYLLSYGCKVYVSQSESHLTDSYNTIKFCVPVYVIDIQKTHLDNN
jgi:hypothetical protein